LILRVTSSIVGYTLGALVLMAAPTLAASKSGAMAAQVNILKACRITATAMDFGTLTKVTGTETATSTVTVTCSAGTTYLVSFRATGPRPNVTVRLNGPAAQFIRTGLTLATTAGTSSGSHVISGLLVAQAVPTPGTYVRVQTVFVIY